VVAGEASCSVEQAAAAISTVVRTTAPRRRWWFTVQQRRRANGRGCCTLEADRQLPVPTGGQELWEASAAAGSPDAYDLDIDSNDDSLLIEVSPTARPPRIAAIGVAVDIVT
jgi:hypothetical protein